MKRSRLPVAVFALSWGAFLFALHTGAGVPLRSGDQIAPRMAEAVRPAREGERAALPGDRRAPEVPADAARPGPSLIPQEQEPTRPADSKRRPASRPAPRASALAALGWDQGTGVG